MFYAFSGCVPTKSYKFVRSLQEAGPVDGEGSAAGGAVRIVRCLLVPEFLLGRRFFGELELRAGREILNVVLQVIPAGEGLATNIDLTAGQRDARGRRGQEKNTANDPVGRPVRKAPAR